MVPANQFEIQKIYVYGYQRDKRVLTVNLASGIRHVARLQIAAKAINSEFPSRIPEVVIGHMMV